MPDAMIHPTPQVLADFGLGKLPEGAAAAVSNHLETCTACRQAVSAGPAGSSFPPGLAKPISASQPATPHVACPDLPPELAYHPRYRILRELGRGGMGVVYQARHREMDRQVVIKVINRTLLGRPDSLERFRREIRAAAQLSHPNIVTAYDAEQAGASHMLVMEFVPGQSLAEVVKKKGVLPVDFACHFMRQVALGLQHAHERKMVHRDIKPQNLILTPKGQVKILDFGLAKVLREEGTSTGLTEHNAYMGTPDYCAPEQASDARTADIRADLYSLGCTLYCLLAGRPPFPEDTIVKTILAHMRKQPQPLPVLRPEVPVELWGVVARLLAKEPGQRYQKPIEVAQALVPFIKPGTKESSQKSPYDLPARAVGPESSGKQVDQFEQPIPPVRRGRRQPPMGKAPPEAAGTTPVKIGDTVAEDPQSGTADDLQQSTTGSPARRQWLIGAGVGAGVLLFALIGLCMIVPFNENDEKEKKDRGGTTEKSVIRFIPPVIKPPKDENKENAPKEPLKKDREEEEDQRILRPQLIKKQPAPATPKGDANSTPVAQENPPTVAEAKKPEVQPAPKPAPPETPLPPDKIKLAIDKGVEALLRLQRADGTWPHEHIGATALAGLTLLESDVKADDGSVVRATNAVRNEIPKLKHTYSIALSILFLDRLGDADDIPLIESLTVRLLAGQDSTGGWDYECPVSDAEVRRLTTLLGQRKQRSGRRETPKPGEVKRSVKDLPKEIQQQLAILNRMGNSAANSDNSNTQFATLGLWVGRRYGLPVDKALRRVETRFRTGQKPDGGWWYREVAGNHPGVQSTASMTSAGLFCLAVSIGEVIETAREKNPAGKPARDISKDAVVKKGLAALAEVIGKPQGAGGAQVGGRTNYFLWALQRVASALDLQTIGKKDWYEWGTQILLANQQSDGAWKGDNAAYGADTCFALLFLKRANLTRDLTPLFRGEPTATGAKPPKELSRREKANLRWSMIFNTNSAPEYVAQLQGLGAILAVPVREASDRNHSANYKIIRDLSSRPAKLLDEDISKIQRIYWVDDKPNSVNGVMANLGLTLRPSHFVAYFPEKLEEKLFQLEKAHLEKNYPGRTEDDIVETRFRINRIGNRYEPVLFALKIK